MGETKLYLSVHALGSAIREEKEENTPLKTILRKTKCFT
jgi:hypothetical protein